MTIRRGRGERGRSRDGPRRPTRQKLHQEKPRQRNDDGRRKGTDWDGEGGGGWEGGGGGGQEAGGDAADADLAVRAVPDEHWLG